MSPVFNAVSAVIIKVIISKVIISRFLDSPPNNGLVFSSDKHSSLLLKG